MAPNQPRPHPFAIPVDILKSVAENIFPESRWVNALADVGDAVINLPMEGANLLRSPQLLVSGNIPEGEVAPEEEIWAGGGAKAGLTVASLRVAKKTAKANSKRKIPLHLSRWDVPVLWLPGCPFTIACGPQRGEWER